MARNKYVVLLQLAFRNLNAFEVALMASIIVLAVASFVIKGEFAVNSCIAALSAVLGVFCVVLGAKGSMANWLFGIVECFLYTYICISGHIYGDALQRIVYTLPMQFVGWHRWRKRSRHDNTTQIHTRYMTWRVRLFYLALTAVCVAGLVLFLKFVGPSLTDFFAYMHFRVRPGYDNELQLWLDSTTTVLAIIAMWISTKAYVEQWYIWLVINVASISIWAMSDTEFSFMTVAKYSVYLVNAFYGIWMWNRLSRPEAAATTKS